jgi:flagellar FliL protein
MAEEKAADKAAEGEAKAGGKKNSLKLIIIIVAAVVLLGGGGGAYFYFKSKAAAEAAAEEGKDGKDEKKKEEKKPVPFFVEFEAFTVNLKEAERFLQIKLTFQVKTAENAEQLKDLMPIVRSAVIPVLGTQETASITTKEGKDKMCAEIVAAANDSLAQTAAADSIDAVLITHMIIQ